MFDVQKTQPRLIRRWLDGDRIAGREAARLHYDHLLLRNLGLEPAKTTEQEEVSPIEAIRSRLDLQEALIRGLLAIAAGDPNPRPNLKPLFDPEVRAESTRALSLKLTAALEVLKRDLDTIEGSGRTVQIGPPNGSAIKS